MQLTRQEEVLAEIRARVAAPIYRNDVKILNAEVQHVDGADYALIVYRHSTDKRVLGLRRQIYPSCPSIPAGEAQLTAADIGGWIADFDLAEPLGTIAPVRGADEVWWWGDGIIG